MCPRCWLLDLVLYRSFDKSSFAVFFVALYVSHNVHPERSVCLKLAEKYITGKGQTNIEI